MSQRQRQSRPVEEEKKKELPKELPKPPVKRERNVMDDIDALIMEEDEGPKQRRDEEDDEGFDG